MAARTRYHVKRDARLRHMKNEMGYTPLQIAKIMGMSAVNAKRIVNKPERHVLHRQKLDRLRGIA